MLKLLICLCCGLAVAAGTLELRQQRLNLNFQTNQLHNQIEARQAKLWNQQLQIAIYTAPNSISRTVGSHDLNMVPRSPLPSSAANWTTPPANPDAE